MRNGSLQPARRLLLAFLITLPMFSRAAAPAADEVLFAGASFVVDAAQVEQRFPLVSAVLREGAPVEGPGPFEQRLRGAVLASTPQHFGLANRDGTQQGNTRRGVAKALSMAFSHESVEFQQMDDKVVAVYDIAAQVLFFDYGAAAPHVIASYPVRVRYTDLTARQPTRAHQLEVVRGMLFSDNRETGLLHVWLRKMVAAAPRGGDRLVMVQLPVFEDKAAAQLPAERQAVAHELAQFVEGVISDEWQVPMVPVTPGQAIRGKMVQVFANGDATEFTLPEPSFTVATTVRDLRKAAAPLEGGGSRVAYGAFVTATVNGPLGRVAELRLKEVLSVTLTDLVKVRLDDWAQFNIALKSVLAQSVGQVTASDRSWTKANSSTPDAGAQLDTIRSKILKR
jgi:hypothetical protein